MSYSGLRRVIRSRFSPASLDSEGRLLTPVSAPARAPRSVETDGYCGGLWGDSYALGNGNI
jgi:hypothetical protein